MSLYDSKQKLMVKAFVVGAIYWVITIFCITGVQYQNGYLLLIGIVLGFASICYLAVKGWGWHSEWKFGTVGGFIKFFVMLILAFTLVGIIPVAYWTGKGILQSIGYVEYDF